MASTKYTMTPVITEVDSDERQKIQKEECRRDKIEYKKVSKIQEQGNIMDVVIY